MTAVEWLEMEIVKLEAKFAIPGDIYQLCEQAKGIEKQQVINAFNNGYLCHSKTGEEYYNETFKN